MSLSLVRPSNISTAETFTRRLRLPVAPQDSSAAAELASPPTDRVSQLKLMLPKLRKPHASTSKKQLQDATNRHFNAGAKTNIGA